MAHWEKGGKSDEWYTPKYIFDAMNFIFDTDVCAPKDLSLIHTPARSFITENSLEKNWMGTVWMNPPFGGRNGIVPWLDKIYQHGNGIALTPDRTSAPWWQKAAKECDAILFISGKVKFISSDGYIGIKPSNGTSLFAYGDISVNILLKAQISGLGMCFKRLSQ